MKRAARWIGLLTAGVVLFVAPATVAHGLWSATATGTLTLGTVPLDVPGNLSAQVTCGQATVSWNAVPTATSYVVSWSPGTGSYTDLSPAATTTSLTLTKGLLDGTRVVQVRVRAVNDAGASADSGSVTIDFQPAGCTPPNVPGSVVQALSDCGSGALTWGNVPQTTGFRVYRRVGASAPYSYTLLADVTTRNATFAQGSMPDNITVVVTSYGTGGESAYSAAVTMTLTCPAPTVLSCGSAQGTSAYSMTFTTVVGATGYRIHYSAGNVTYFYVATSATSPYVQTGFTSDGTSYWRVRSSNGLVASPFSNTIKIVRSNAGATWSCEGVTP